MNALLLPHPLPLWHGRRKLLFLYKVDSNYLKSNISPFKLILKTKL